jgi:hypothetical protein
MQDAFIIWWRIGYIDITVQLLLQAVPISNTVVAALLDISIANDTPMVHACW